MENGVSPFSSPSGGSMRKYRSVSPGKPSHPHLPHSSDSLLHHLHTDPQASHISLSSNANNSGPRNASPTVPGARVIKGLMGKPVTILPPSPPALENPVRHSPSPASSSAGIAFSNPRTPDGSLPVPQRTRVRTSRPKTAPSRPSNDNLLPPLETGGPTSVGTTPSPSREGDGSYFHDRPRRTSKDSTSTADLTPGQPSSSGIRRQTSAPLVEDESFEEEWPSAPQSSSGSRQNSPEVEKNGLSGIDHHRGDSNGKGKGKASPSFPVPIDSVDAQGHSASRGNSVPTIQDDNGFGLSGSQEVVSMSDAEPDTDMDGESCVDQALAEMDNAVGATRSRQGSGTESSKSSTSSKHRLMRLVGSSAQLRDDHLLALGDQTLEHASAGRGTPAGRSDWGAFIKAYSSGNWDPNRIPHPPSMTPIQETVDKDFLAKATSEGPGGVPRLPPIQSRQTLPSPTLAVKLVPNSALLSRRIGTAPDPMDGGPSLASDIASLEVPQHRPAGSTNSSISGTFKARRTSVPDNMGHSEQGKMDRDPIRASGPAAFIDSPQAIGSSSSSDHAGAAAHIRLASVNFTAADFAPFNVPSPEKELLDPMSSHAVNPVTRNRSIKKSSTMSATADAANRGAASLLAESWSGFSTRDIESWQEAEQSARLPNIVGTSSAETDEKPARRMSSNTLRAQILPASAPLAWKGQDEDHGDGEYFGSALAPTSSDVSRTPSSHTMIPNIVEEAASSSMSTPSADNFVDKHRRHKPKSALNAHLQTSSESRLSKLFNAHESPASLNSPKASEPQLDSFSPVLTIEEQSFQNLGYLPAPMPPNEMERRKALYRFNILQTAPDFNFDRIAHMVKLVFSSKIVLVSLIDDQIQFNKVDNGLGATHANRMSSLCAHSILARNAEPLVILDTHKDWRFAASPNVVGYPFIRFYAGAPLRTSDGYNLGSLCIIDDRPRTEFPPRSRLILREFAAIVVREMELWRDKIQLRARDRIQSSMERFTRECLELDNTAEAGRTSGASKMDKVYERAVRLVRKTLDVDGALLMDLSHFEKRDIFGDDDRPKTVFQADAYDPGSTQYEEEQPFGHAQTSENTSGARAAEFPTIAPWSVLGSSEQIEIPATRSRVVNPAEHAAVSDFLLAHGDGRIYERVVPIWLRHALPSGLQHVMVVPIFNVDRHPFALLCAYTTDKTKQFLEGYELQFLRAIGVVILSAVLKQRMILADKAKGNFISNISHELRTPLHGILAAAELLGDTPLDSTQEAFLRTVQACGNSLIETVNHVLDFTKLNGNTKHNIENTIKPGSVNIARLVEETVEGCWIGQRARAFQGQGQSEIGSFYSPPEAPHLVDRSVRSSIAEQLSHVETVIDVGMRDQGWQVRCEKGGIRRVLMNLIGNSLKFTQDGYVQVTLRELPHSPGSRTIPIELAVIDTGKGISRSFLKEQLFHPFSQENPLQTGTGLGLAIVNSIVRSDSVNGKVDVWSSEGLGTEIKITLDVEVEDDSKSGDTLGMASSKDSMFGQGKSVSFVGFNADHRGIKLNRQLMENYARWWNFDIHDDSNGELGDIVVVHEDRSVMTKLIAAGGSLRPILTVTATHIARTGEEIQAYSKAGGFAQHLFKPVGPTRLEAAFRACVESLETVTPSQSVTRSSRLDYFSPQLSPIHPGRSPSSVSGGLSPQEILRRNSSLSYRSDDSNQSPRPTASRESSAQSTQTETGSSISELPGISHTLSRLSSNGRLSDLPTSLLRRRSEEGHPIKRSLRPAMAPRSTTYEHQPEPVTPKFYPNPRSRTASLEGDQPSMPSTPGSVFSTISLADGGAMLKLSAPPSDNAKLGRNARVIVVDDNMINLNLLSAYMRKKGIECLSAADGKQAVDIFESKPVDYWDLILMDMQMPVMDGRRATEAIRRIETERWASDESVRFDTSKHHGILPPPQMIQARTKIFALTGLGGTDDRKAAFASGVDGYLVKPVSFKSIEGILNKLGFL